MRNLDFSETLEVLTFFIALMLYGWASDRSQEPVAAIGMLATLSMFVFSVARRGN